MLMSPLYELNERSNGWDPRLKEALAYIVPTAVAGICFWGVFNTPFPWSLVLAVVGTLAAAVELCWLVAMLIYYTTR